MACPSRSTNRCARRCRTRRAWASPRNTPTPSRSFCRTAISTAKRFASTERFGSRRNRYFAAPLFAGRLRRIPWTSRGRSRRCGQAAQRDVERLRAWNVLSSPAHEREQDVAHVPALRGQRVGKAHRTLLVSGFFDDAGVLEAAQAVGKNIGRNTLVRFQHLAVGLLAAEQVADHQQ